VNSKEIQGLLEENEADLRGMNHVQLTRWAKDNGIDDGYSFTIFKNKLEEIGISYSALREEAEANAAAETASGLCGSVTLCVSADATTQKFAIATLDGKPVWYGKFFDNDVDFNGNQISADFSVAKKAIWLASKITESVGGVSIHLTLRVSQFAQHDVTELTQIGIQRRVAVTLDIQDENPSVKFVRFSGFKKWADNDLSALIEPLED